MAIRKRTFHLDEKRKKKSHRANDDNKTEDSWNVAKKRQKHESKIEQRICFEIISLGKMFHGFHWAAP